MGRIITSDIRKAGLYFAVRTHYGNIKKLKLVFHIGDTRNRSVNIKRQTDKLILFIDQHQRFPKSSEIQYLFHICRTRYDLKEKLIEEFKGDLRTSSNHLLYFKDYFNAFKTTNTKLRRPRIKTVLKITKQILSFYQIHNRFPERVSEMPHLYKFLKSAMKNVLFSCINFGIKSNTRDAEFEKWQRWLSEVKRKYNTSIDTRFFWLTIKAGDLMRLTMLDR